MVRLQRPGPPESSRDGRENWRRSWPTIPWRGRRIPKLGSAANANQGAKIGSDSGSSFSSAFSQRMAPVRRIFRSLNPNASPVELGQFGRFPAQEQVLGCLLAVLLEAPRPLACWMKLSHFAWSGLRFAKYSAYAFGSGAMPRTGTRPARRSWRRHRGGRNNRAWESDRTCGRGSERSSPSSAIIPRETTSMRSSIVSWMLSRTAGRRSGTRDRPTLVCSRQGRVDPRQVAGEGIDRKADRH